MPDQTPADPIAAALNLLEVTITAIDSEWGAEIGGVWGCSRTIDELRELGHPDVVTLHAARSAHTAAVAETRRLHEIIDEADDALGDLTHPRWDGGDRVQRLTRVLTALREARLPRME